MSEHTGLNWNRSHTLGLGRHNPRPISLPTGLKFILIWFGLLLLMEQREGKEG